MTSGKQSRNRFWTYTPAERAADARSRLATVRCEKERWIAYRDNCAHMAANAARRVEELTAEELTIMQEVEGKT